MAMKLKQDLQNALTAAMKARDEDAKRTLRLVISSIKLSEIETGREIDDSRVLSILQKEVKTREDTIKESQKANRVDLVSAAEREIEVLNRFLPKQMSAEALYTLAKQVVDEVGAKELRDMGEVMKQLMPKLQGRASGQEASSVVRNLLQN